MHWMRPGTSRVLKVPLRTGVPPELLANGLCVMLDGREPCMSCSKDRSLGRGPRGGEGSIPPGSPLRCALSLMPHSDHRSHDDWQTGWMRNASEGWAEADKADRRATSAYLFFWAAAAETAAERDGGKRDSQLRRTPEAKGSSRAARAGCRRALSQPRGGLCAVVCIAPQPTWPPLFTPTLWRAECLTVHQWPPAPIQPVKGRPCPGLGAGGSSRTDCVEEQSSWPDLRCVDGTSKRLVVVLIGHFLAACRRWHLGEDETSSRPVVCSGEMSMGENGRGWKKNEI